MKDDFSWPQVVLLCVFFGCVAAVIIAEILH